MVSINQVKESIYHKNLDTIIIIAPHTQLVSGTIEINIANQFTLDFSSFGDLSTYKNYPSDLDLIGLLHDSDVKNLSFQYQDRVNYDYAIPLALLDNNLAVKYVLIGVNNCSDEQITSFATSLTNILHVEKKRVGMIISGDLSHQIEKSNSKLKLLAADNLILDWLKNKESFINSNQLLTSHEFSQAGICLYQPLLLGLTILSNINYQCNILRTDSLAGINYLIAEFII